MTINKIRILYDDLFNTCPEITKVGVWVVYLSTGVTVLDEDYEINEKSKTEICDNRENVAVINETISVFRDYTASEKQDIMQRLEGLREKSYSSNSILNAINNFNFAVDVEPFKKYLGPRFPWEIIKIGVWFEIYRNGKIKHYVDWKRDDDDNEDEKVEIKVKDNIK